MIPVKDIVEIFQLMNREHWSYVDNGSSYGSVDCQGAFKYAYKKCGESCPWSGSNDMARNYVVHLIPLSQAKLEPGMAIFRARAPGDKNYKLGSSYQVGGSKYNGDLNDYYHIGLVDEDTRYHLNASSEKRGFQRDIIGTNGYAAYLKAVDYGSSVSNQGSRFTFSHYPLRAMNAEVTSEFGMRNGSPHNGIDLGVKGNPDGTIVVQAVMSGKVTRASRSDSYGNVVYIEHSPSLQTRYAHLHSLSVGVGEEVTAGTQLGYMGTTGDSSAPHLHFEVLINDEKVDPKPYLPVIDTMSTSPLGSSETPEESGYNILNVPYTPTQIVGRRVSQISRQPLHAYVKISIGGKILSTDPPRPNNIQRLTVNRLNNSGTTAEFSIFDDNWDEIEYALKQSYEDIVIEYGYKNQIKPPRSFHFRLADYSIEFNMTGTILNISALSKSSYDNLNPTTFDEVSSYNPTEAIKEICKSLGYTIGHMEETVDIQMENPFTLLSDRPITYIQEIVKMAQTPDGEIASFNIDESTDPPTANLTKLTYEDNRPTYIKTYIYQKGYDSPVQSLSFNINGIFGGAGSSSTASGLQSGVIDTKSKDIEYIKETNRTAIVSATGKYQDMREDQSIPHVEYGGSSPDQAHKKLYYSLQYAFNRHYTANMVILGDPTLEMLQNVRIINITDSGKLHHTSGIYMVQKIVDSISDGEYLTTLELVRNGSINEGVELLSPKVLIK